MTNGEDDDVDCRTFGSFMPSDQAHQVEADIWTHVPLSFQHHNRTSDNVQMDKHTLVECFVLAFMYIHFMFPFRLERARAILLTMCFWIAMKNEW